MPSVSSQVHICTNKTHDKVYVVTCPNSWCCIQPVGTLLPEWRLDTVHVWSLHHQHWVSTLNYSYNHYVSMFDVKPFGYFPNRGVVVSAVCVYPANNSKNDANDAGGNNGGVFDIFRTPLINPLTGVRASSGYVEVGIW